MIRAALGRPTAQTMRACASKGFFRKKTGGISGNFNIDLSVYLQHADGKANILLAVH
jgi:hypothetical protein